MAATVVKVDRRFMEKILCWDQLSRAENFRHYDPDPKGNRWVFRLLQNRALHKMPTGNIERMFQRFEEIAVVGGQIIMREGDPADYFYVIKEGTCAVSKHSTTGDAVVAYLVRGDTFGEDALLTNSTRNATGRDEERRAPDAAIEPRLHRGAEAAGGGLGLARPGLDPGAPGRADPGRAHARGVQRPGGEGRAERAALRAARARPGVRARAQGGGLLQHRRAQRRGRVHPVQDGHDRGRAPGRSVGHGAADREGREGRRPAKP
jgi:hypothetical protein